MKRSVCLLLCLGFLLEPTLAKGEKIRYAIFPAPPYMIGADEQGKEISGVDVEIAREIAKQLNLELEFVKCPWARCLELMKAGDADLLSSAYKRPEREAYMLYFETPYLDQLPIAFYFEKGAGLTVAKYEDLYRLKSIGVLRGAGYFERFDQDAQLKKYEVASQDQLFPMLAAGRLDAIAGYVTTENYRIIAEGYAGKIERSQYEYAETAYVYMTLSKKSPLAQRLDEFNQVNTQLAKDGVLARIRDAYYAKYTPQ